MSNSNDLDRMYSQVEQLSRSMGKEHYMAPQFKFLKYLSYSLTFPGGRRATDEEIKWCVEHCTGDFSQDHTCSPFAFSFANKEDMLLFKLTFGVGRPTHVRY